MHVLRRKHMRKLGLKPLTGAEKQRRHREKVKARLAEAERLRQRLGDGAAASLPGLGDFYEAILVELGAGPDERGALGENIDVLRSLVDELVRQRAGRELDELRARRRASRSSLLGRLAADKPATDVG